VVRAASGATTQTTAIFILAAVRTSNPIDEVTDLYRSAEYMARITEIKNDYRMW
jgi:hypothetical protein